jgi:hypothetical protein
VDRDDRLREIEERYEGYTVYDDTGEKIGKVDDLFIDDTGREEYIGVKMGLFGLEGKTMIPMELARVDEQERRIEVAASKDQVKDAPHYHDDDDIDHEFEARIREYFGLERQEATPERGTYGRYDGAAVGEGGPLSGATGSVEDRDLVGRETQRGDLGGSPSGTTTTGPVEERTPRHGADETLASREETRDVPLGQPVVLVRVRRVRILP